MVSWEMFIDKILQAGLWFGLNQVLTEMSTRNISWGKGGRCVGVTNLPPLSANYIEIRELQLPENFSAYPNL